jgi:hypothetical protein
MAKIRTTVSGSFEVDQVWEISDELINRFNNLESKLYNENYEYDENTALILYEFLLENSTSSILKDAIFLEDGDLYFNEINLLS